MENYAVCHDEFLNTIATCLVLMLIILMQYLQALTFRFHNVDFTGLKIQVYRFAGLLRFKYFCRSLNTKSEQPRKQIAASDSAGVLLIFNFVVQRNIFLFFWQIEAHFQYVKMKNNVINVTSLTSMWVGTAWCGGRKHTEPRCNFKNIL